MRELIPAFRFLAIFVGLYFGLNLLYGLWIYSYGTQVDAATSAVTRQSSVLLNLFGEKTSIALKLSSPSISILNPSGVVVNVFEGCNGLNVMIVFVAFLFAFSEQKKKITWFLPLGLLIIYIANIGRVMALYYVAEYWKAYFYYVHKYVLTAFLYALVFVLWWFWIEKISGISLRNVTLSKQS
ncbi:MAG TPA: exosortase family protein XrtF [Cyclobacteriaceae bacterium]|nr:exosortase family protein XrtF [Cyclobacteriaceae bacterium]